MLDELTFRVEVGEQLIHMNQSISRILDMVNLLIEQVERTNQRLDRLEGKW